MAHEILGQCFIEATHNGREAAWHGVGIRKDGEFLTLAEILAPETGINFSVEFAPLYAGNDRRPVEFLRAIRRTDTGEVLSGVGDRYEINPHTGFLSDVDEALGGAHFETAGVLRGGREVFAAVQGEQFTIGATDILEPYVLLKTSYDGTSPTRCKAVITRAVCKNTVRAAVAETGTSFDYSFRHTASSKERIAEVLRAVSKATAATEAFHKAAEIMATQEFDRPLAATVIQTALETAYGSLDSAKTERAVNRRKETFEAGAQYMAGALALPENVSAGKWGLLNAVTQWTDHKLTESQRESSRRSSSEKRFESIIDGRADTVKEAVFSLIYLTTKGEELEVPIYGPEAQDGRTLLDRILMESGN